ncbi:hypothetical protein NQ318_016959 [Aromia moschata]|uniref:tRNA (guanine(26)-N(2))-dimethyltransferase n=1 Tax=Aromia moschata TaxID=1265417 RepID=A0AAV8YDZ4_9CUCU|nr:hypothetical protein NQ318_016959 [Aromia moschata]
MSGAKERVMQTINIPHMEMEDRITNSDETQIITEGLAQIKTSGKVFYNPVQEFNRDLSISVITTFIKHYNEEKLLKQKKRADNIKININQKEEIDTTYENGVSILEALSATGLRSIRYAKEIPGVKKVIANDISQKAVDDIKINIVDNKVDHIVEASHSDATMLMYQHRRENQFDIIDLDPYGCPSNFFGLDSTGSERRWFASYYCYRHGRFSRELTRNLLQQIWSDITKDEKLS